MGELICFILILRKELSKVYDYVSTHYLNDRPRPASNLDWVLDMYSMNLNVRMRRQLYHRVWWCIL